jgi:N-methylhydantoinase B
MREVLGGGSGGRYYADGEDTIHVVPDSRNLPTEFTESRFPFIVERLGLAVDSGGAGQFRGGLGYEKQIRMLKDAHFMSIADRSILACWGVRGGKAGRALPGRHRPRRPRRARGRRPRRRRADQGRPGRSASVPPVAAAGATRWPATPSTSCATWSGARSRLRPRCADYGVVLTGSADGGDLGHDASATETERAGRAAWSREDDAFFDRGPGYAALADGATHASVDRI